MSFKNAIQEGTETVIDSIRIDKNSKNISVECFIYEDDRRLKKILSPRFEYLGVYECREIDKVYTSLDDIKEEGKDFFVMSSVKDESGYYDSKFKEIYQPDENNKPKLVSKTLEKVKQSIMNPFIYVKNKYYRFENGVFVEFDGSGTSKWWDANFSCLAQKDYNDLYNLMYTFLKNNETIFKNCEGA